MMAKANFLFLARNIFFLFDIAKFIFGSVTGGIKQEKCIIYTIR